MINYFKNEWRKIKEAQLIEEINKIKVNRPETGEEELVEVDNPTDLPLLTRHKKYAIFGLDEKRCIKIFPKVGKAEQEYHNQRLGAKQGISPQVYDWGPNYIVMESINSPTVAQYLDSYPLTKELTEKLIRLFKNLKEAGFSINQAPENILIMPSGSLMAIGIKSDAPLAAPFPKKMIKGMGKQVSLFLEYVKEIDEALYISWSSHPDFNGYVAKANQR
ncbi:MULTISPECIES: hypothetical protein [unclassified Paenibacillus]|uniref:hypothetical protein n=1 Tax=unclassified Paenibacillus TaxID=185978 RepID=UPI001AE629FA|nr:MULTISPECIES: hypothetical protein [unclassified Paenibacillus]MBP1155873.1 hypothetical protein [Paenibacillus sp. PvP091]MBP1168741.1 hypothetical protein [Paenibacillus sp. PvR098]MBP2439769.1 hypothetical protein [Paenibacillus sp. PvP052]